MTPRTRQILTLKANGYSTKQIADTLSLHRRTVDWHLSKAVTAMNAKNVTHAVARAIVKGILTAGEIGMVLILSWSCFTGSVDIRTPVRVPTRIVRQVRREV